jgi:hypothetical protein
LKAQTKEQRRSDQCQILDQFALDQADRHRSADASGEIYESEVVIDQQISREQEH